MEHIVTDRESNRTFCLIVENGALLRLQEERPYRRTFPSIPYLVGGMAGRV